MEQDSGEKTRVQLLLIALGIAAGLIFLTLLLPDNNVLAVVFFDRAGGFPVYPLTLQNLMWVLFSVGLGELYYRYQFVQADRVGLDTGYLSTRPEVFYNMDDLLIIRKQTYDKNDMVARLINVLTIRYQVSQKSVEETHQMLNSQLELRLFKLDVDYNMIRYISWLIPTLGFIGTVIGISLTLAAAGVPGAAEQDDFLHQLTSQLALAFNTTLVALLMSGVLVYIMHLVQGAEERIIHRCGDYCLNHFINKLISK